VAALLSHKTTIIAQAKGSSSLSQSFEPSGRSTTLISDSGQQQETFDSGRTKLHNLWTLLVLPTVSLSFTHSSFIGRATGWSAVTL